MVKIVSSDVRIKAALEKLRDILLREGAYFHPTMSIVYNDGNFSVHTTSSVNKDERIIYIPEKCCVHSNKFLFKPSDSEILVQSLEADVPDLEREVSAAVFEIYNLSGKLGQFRESSVYSLYNEGRDLFRALTKNYIFDVTEYFEKMPFDLAFIKFFLKLRSLGKNQIIVPFVEYFNHDRSAKIPSFNKVSGDMEISSCMPFNQNELFINYGLDQDVRAFFLYQGFVDTSIEVLNSLPLEFTLEGINIAIYRNSVKPLPEELPFGMEDMYGYLPYIDFGHGSTIVFGFLYIPGKAAPFSLRRILYYAIRKNVADPDKATLLMRKMEHKIISENLKFYEELKRALYSFKASHNNAKFVANAKDMVEFEISIIKNYAFFNEAMKVKI